MSDVGLTSKRAQTGDGERAILARLAGGCISGTALASAARSATTLSSNIDARGARAIIVYLNITAASGTGGLTLRLFGVDPVSSTVATSASVSTAATTSGTRIYHFGPGVGAASGATLAWGGAGVMLGSLFAVQVLHGDASSYTYSVTYELI